MIADDRVGNGKERARNDPGPNSDLTQKSALSLPSMTTPPGQAQRSEHVAQNIHKRPPPKQSGVSVNLSGSTVILANPRCH